MFECDGVLIDGTSFVSNLGANFGGSIMAEGGSNITLRGNSFVDGSCESEGGAIYLSATSASIEDCSFDNCSAPIQGGGVAASSGSNLVVRGNRFSGNSSQIGAGYYQTGGSLELEHNLFNANTVSVVSSAAYVSAVTSCTFVGNTFAENNTTTGGPTVIIDSDTPVDARNNIIANNTGSGILCSGDPLNFSYNLFWNNSSGDYSGCTAGVTDLSLAPLFVNAAGGDFHLAQHSPAIDAGDPTGVSDPDGGRADLGWYGSRSFVMDQPVFPQNASASVLASDVLVSWDANSEVDVVSYLVYGGTTAGFVPDAANLLATVPAPATSANLGNPSPNQFFKVAALDGDGYASGYSSAVEATATDAPSSALVTALLGNTPNPFNPSTLIRYEISRDGPVQLFVYDATGRVLRRLVDGRVEAGRHEMSWDGRDGSGQRVASGIYFYKLIASGDSYSRKMVLVK
jgi:hypothetical protein